MKSNVFKFVLFLSSLLVAVLYTNCGSVLNPGSTQSIVNKSTETGNALTSNKIVDSLCDVLLNSHPELNRSDCETGLKNTMLSSQLGVPSQVYNPFRTLEDAEKAGAVQASPPALEGCLNALKNLDPDSSIVKSAYEAGVYDPFTKAKDMIPSSGAMCELVYKNNQFEIPTPPVPPAGVTIVDFDFPEPLTPSPYLRGLYKGVDFGNEWGWHRAFNAATTNHLYFDQRVKKLSFNFSGGAKILDSLKVFTSSGSGSVVISDDQGQSASLFIQADLQLHEIVTGFTKPSNMISIEIPSPDFGIGIDDIRYRVPPNPQPVYFIQSNSQMITAPVNAMSFYSDVQAGSFVIVQAIHNEEWKFQSISDTQGNLFNSLSTIVSAHGAVQHLWYFRPKQSGKTSIQVRYVDDGRSNYNGLHIYEYGGVSKQNPIGTNLSLKGLGPNITSGPIAVNSGNEMIFAAGNSDSGPILGQPGYTKRNLVIYGLGADRFATDIGNYQFSATRADSDQGWLLQILTLRP